MVGIKDFYDWHWVGGANESDSEAKTATLFANHCVKKFQTDLLYTKGWDGVECSVDVSIDGVESTYKHRLFGVFREWNGAIACFDLTSKNFELSDIASGAVKDAVDANRMLEDEQSKTRVLQAEIDALKAEHRSDLRDLEEHFSQRTLLLLKELDYYREFLASHYRLQSNPTSITVDKNDAGITEFINKIQKTEVLQPLLPTPETLK